jgi:hypothetical protein
MNEESGAHFPGEHCREPIILLPIDLDVASPKRQS